MGSSYGIAPAVGWAIGAYGSKPKVPPFVPVDTSKEQLGAITGNIAALPKAEELASKTNLFNQEQYNQMLESVLPGGREQVVSNISSLLKGEIPQDVQAQIQRQTAEQAISGGYAGSQFQRNLTSRDLGLTSLNLTQQGLSSAERWISLTKAPQLDVSSMFITPMQKIGVDIAQNEFKFQRDLLAAKIKAAPDPFKQAIVQDLGGAVSDVAGVAGSYYGSAGGGGGGGSL